MPSAPTSPTTASAMEFRHTVKAISELFRGYSFRDIATSLFVSSIWLPNIASPVKHQLLAAALVSQSPRDFSASDRIVSYEDFRAFIERVYPLLTSFPWLEDYIPEPDWGEIKFHHRGQNYKIFYGNELSNVYDFLALFEILHESFDKEYRTCTKRSPVEELEYCLQLQDDLISGITTQPTVDRMSQLSPGYLEIPPLEFWENASAFYSNYSPYKLCNSDFINRFSIQSGSLARDFLELNSFVDLVFTGKLLPVFFILNEGKYFPLLPRRYFSILFDSWGEVYEKHHREIVDNGVSYSQRIGAELYRFVKSRIQTPNLFAFASAVNNNGPHEIIFPCTFISKDKLVLIYVTAPAVSVNDISNELVNAAPRLQEAVQLIRAKPTSLALHLDKCNVQFRNENAVELLEPVLLVVVPEASTQNQVFSLPEGLLARVVFLDQFLGVIDELNDVDELASFIEYLDGFPTGVIHPISSFLDLFGSFKSSHGVLLEGASEYNFIGLDPHWGSNMRFESLLKFWKLYPQVDFFDHPRSWRIKQESPTRIRLDARSYLGCALCCQVGSTTVFITAPFHRMSYEQAQITNLLMECLDDSVSRNREIVREHRFFHFYEKCQVNFFPSSLIAKSDDFSHLRHLHPDNRYWDSDCGLIHEGEPGVRLLFDDERLIRVFIDVKDSSLEVSLLLEVLNQLNSFSPDSRMDSIREALEQTKSRPPRFKLFEAERPAFFPEPVDDQAPLPGHYKKARKRVAELAKRQGISEGTYAPEEAKIKLNSLRNLIVQDIASEITQYSSDIAIPYLLSRIGALSHKYELGRQVVKHSIGHEVDYVREERHARGHSEFVRMHRNYRYLIEKFVQLLPSAKTALKKEEFQYLIALVDWLHVLYDASDNIHYNIYPVGVRISADYTISIEYQEEISSKEKTFAQEEAQLELGLLGNPKDRVTSPRPVDDCFTDLDEAFRQDRGFGFRAMLQVLHILTDWPSVKSGVTGNTHYAASSEAIVDACSQTIEGFDEAEGAPILEFLTLKSQDVIRVYGQPEPCSDIPVWEHQKRFARYNIRPLVVIGSEYYWCPYSTRRAGIIWSGAVSEGILATDLHGPSIQAVLKKQKKLIENALVQGSLAIVKRYTSYAGCNVRLDRIDKKGNHPPSLGDYDVLAYYPEKNTVLNIECKDISPAFCLKDAKRLRDRILGPSGKEGGYLRRIIRRQEYLLTHLPKVAGALEWPIEGGTSPKIIPMYLSRRAYWWTRFPPFSTDVVFLRVDLLSNFIEQL